MAKGTSLEGHNLRDLFVLPAMLISSSLVMHKNVYYPIFSIAYRILQIVQVHMIMRKMKVVIDEF